jgi:hypothetical protein
VHAAQPTLIICVSAALGTCRVVAFIYGMRLLQLLYSVLVVRRAGHGRHFTQNFVVAANNGPSAIDRVVAELGTGGSLVELLLCTGLGGQVVQLGVRSIGKQQLARLTAKAEFIRSAAAEPDERGPDQEAARLIAERGSVHDFGTPHGADLDDVPGSANEIATGEEGNGQ